MSVEMVDVGGKDDVERRAVAEGCIHLSRKTLKAVAEGGVKKGDVLAAAQVAGILAVKRTWEAVPLCHPIPLTFADVSFQVREDRIVCRCEVRATYKTGVEMEALYGTSVALLTVWDMVKYLEKDERGQYPHTAISDIVVLSKEKGQ